MTEAKRRLTLTAIISIIFFNVCGGPYAIEGVVGAGPGLATLLIILTPLVWSVPMALVCAELGTAIPEEGGYYAWTRRTSGPFLAFCQGWWSWLFTVVDIGTYPTMMCDYAAYFVPALGEEGNFWARRGLMVGMVWIFVLLNLRGSKIVGDFSRIFTVLVLLPFVLLVGIGIWRGLTVGIDHHPVSPFLAPGKGFSVLLAGTLPMVLWNYLGWDSVSTIAGEMENPRRDYPRALAVAVVLIALCYGLPVLTALCFFGEADGIRWDSGAWGVVGERLGGVWLGNLMSAMGIVSAIGLFSSLVLVYSRLPYVMARDGYFPKVFAKTNRYGAPWVSLVASGCVYSLVVIGFKDLEAITTVDVTLFTAVMSLEFIAFLVLRRREPELERPFKVPGGWVGAIAVCALPWICAAGGLGCIIAEKGARDVVGYASLLMLIPVVTNVAAGAGRRMFGRG
ncbi:MAG: APC family permease [Planctomycetales bacterium]